MLCTYGHRRDPYSIRGCISPDGIYWDVANEFIIASAQTAPQEIVGELFYHIGYPTTIQLNDGSLLTVYHEWKNEEPIVQYVVGVRHEVIG
jgi:hypothetical protein